MRNLSSSSLPTLLAPAKHKESKKENWQRDNRLKVRCLWKPTVACLLDTFSTFCTYSLSCPTTFLPVCLPLCHLSMTSCLRSNCKHLSCSRHWDWGAPASLSLSRLHCHCLQGGVLLFAPAELIHLSRLWEIIHFARLSNWLRCWKHAQTTKAGITWVAWLCAVEVKQNLLWIKEVLEWSVFFKLHSRCPLCYLEHNMLSIP